MEVTKYSILYHQGKSSPILFDGVYITGKINKLKLARESTGFSWIKCVYHLYVTGRFRVVRMISSKTL